MKKTTVAVFTGDDFLFTKILLSAPEGVEVIRGEFGVMASLTLFDLDTANVGKIDGAVTMSRVPGRAALTIPFSIDTLANLLNEERPKRPALSLDPEKRVAYLHGEPIKLTEVERSLLSLLISSGGEYVSRDEILKSVWSGEGDGGVINVYVHYLREKLEVHGEKIIISSRKCGYKIDEKYLSEEAWHA